MSDFRDMFSTADAASVLQQAGSQRFAHWRMHPAAALPSAAELAHVVNILLEASLLAEEGRAVRSGVAFAPRGAAASAHSVHVLAEPLELTAKLIRKLGLATDATRTYFLVDHPEIGGAPSVWGLFHLGGGAVTSCPPYLHARATGPATLSVEYFHEPLWALERGRNVVRADTVSSLAALARALGGAPNDRRAQCLARVVLEAQKLGHGGTIALCDRTRPGSDGGFALSVRGPLHTQLAEQHELQQRRSVSNALCIGYAPTCPAYEQAQARDQLDDRSAFLARLTNIDGALVLASDDLAVLRFGATLSGVMAGRPHVFELDASTPSARPVATTLQRLGGTRHQSAARWVCADREHRVALVLSSDGPISLMHGISLADGVGVTRHLAFSS